MSCSWCCIIWRRVSKKGVLVSVFYVRCSQKCAVPADGSGWSATLADYIRNNDQVLVDQAKRLLRTFEEEIQPCESLVELCDVLGLGSSLFALLGSYLCCLCLLFVSSSYLLFLLSISSLLSPVLISYFYCLFLLFVSSSYLLFESPIFAVHMCYSLFSSWCFHKQVVHTARTTVQVYIHTATRPQ